MSSSAITTQVAQLKIGNVQNQADTSSVYSAGVWSFKNSTALTSVTITDAGAVTLGPSGFTGNHVVNGNVGIGTASPTRKLHINGAVNISDGNSDRFVMSFGASGVSLNNNDNSAMIFATSNAPRMTIDASGNVGIGTTSPSTKLQVNGGIAIQGSSFPTTGAGLEIVYSGNQSVLQSYDRGASVYRGAQLAAADIELFSSGANPIRFTTNSTERMRIDASGNVGIGTTPSAFGSYYPAIQAEAPSGFVISSKANNIEIGSNYVADNTFTYRYITSGQGAVLFNASAPQFNGAFTWSTAAPGTAGNVITWSERMRIDASGNLLVGSTTDLGAGVLQVNDRAGRWCATFAANNPSAGTYYFLNIKAGGNNVGSITSSTTTTTYATSSDYRLKENVQPMAAALSKVAALKPCTYKWKVDGSEGEGFIAHELAEVCPAAVTGEKDAVNEDGSIKPQGIDPSKLIGLLTAAIQELSAKNEALEARLAALEAK